MSDPQPERRVDASRRTHLANERTYLAWLRSAMGSIAVGLAIAKLLPRVETGPAWPYAIVGAGFCAIGLAMAWLGVERFRRTARMLERGEFTRLDDRAVLALGVATLVLALTTIGLVVLDV
jgi:putative membrane protein